jgi:glycosyltransferase involved in cell wall biosynthesis
VTNPKISIVVPTLNQGKHLEETLRSLVNQDYRPLEVIIQDGASTDETIQIAQEFVRKFPDVFQLVVERDNGQGHRLNLGFQRTTGAILGFLHSDDTLFPGCLSRVAKEINPETERYIVMGRSLFSRAGEPNEPYLGIEHPCEFVDHFHHLAIWKRGVNTIPQPSVFWHRSVWEICGSIDEGQDQALDYELFLRFSKRYRFHRIDELWSTYRVQSESKIFSLSDTEILDLLFRVSREHWGPWSSPLRWRCELSFWLHNPKKFERARHHARLAEDGFLNKAYSKLLRHAAATFILDPKLAWKRIATQFLVYRFQPVVETLLLRPKHSLKDATPRYDDGWIGPNFAEKFEIQYGIRFLVLQLEFFRPRPLKTKIDFQADGRRVKRLTCWRSGTFDVRLNVAKYRGRAVTIQVVSSSSFQPGAQGDLDDPRRLSLRIRDLHFE